MLIPEITLPDLISMTIWTALICIVAWLIYQSRRDIPEYRYFMPGLLMKLLGGFLFGLVYVYYYHGGDTLAYYDGAIKLNRLFMEDPGLYFQQLFSGQDMSDYYRVYNTRTGYPPIWIYRESEGFFVCKIGSLFTFLGMGSYWAANLLISACSFCVSWKLFRLILRYDFIRPLYAAVAMLFLPTVAFWCSGISKDAFIYIAFFYLIYALFRWISFGERPGLAKLALAGFMIFVLLSIRSFMLIALIIPLFFVLNLMVRKRVQGLIPRLGLSTATILLTIGMSVIYIRFQQRYEALSVEKYTHELMVVQQDFTNNVNYGDNRYDLGLNEFNTAGFIRVIPGALSASFFRPYVWESASIFMLFFSFEGFLLFILSLRFLFWRNAISKFRLLVKNELLLFLLVTVFILGYIVGLSSVLFGVLVRLKAILLPLLAIILLINYQKLKINTGEKTGNSDAL